MSKLPTNVTNFVNALQGASQRIGEDSSDVQFLKLDKVEGWIYGADDIQVVDDSRWAINPNSFATGFAAWDDSEFVDEIMGLITEPPIIKADLPDVGARWDSAVSFEMVCLDGEDEGVKVLYKTTSKGGQKAFRAVLNEVLPRAQANEADLVPIVNLERDSYKHKKYGTIAIPMFTVVSWSNMAASPADVPEPEKAPEVIEKPKTRRRRRG